MNMDLFRMFLEDEPIEVVRFVDDLFDHLGDEVEESEECECCDGCECCDECEDDEELYALRAVFNNPATIVFWNDGTKTVVKAQGEEYDPEKGIALCFMKKYLGNTSGFNNVLKDLLSSYYCEEE